MNEASLSTVDEGPGGWEQAAAAHADVRELFITLGKALRAYRLYEENNPVYKRFVGNLREAFGKVWEGADRVSLRVEEWRLVMDGAEVFSSDSRADSIAFMLYRDGIRDITFLPGIEQNELERFLSVLQRARHAGTQGDDLLSLLWEEELECFRYRYVDLLQDELPPGVEPGSGDAVDAPRVQAILAAELAEEGEAEEGEAASAERAFTPKISQDSFNPTLYSLDPREIEILQREIEAEVNRDLRGDVLAALFDRLEEPARPERQSEILGIFRTLLPNLLGRGALEAATSVLAEMQAVESVPDVLDDQLRSEVAELLDELSSPEVLDELVRALQEGSIAPAPLRLSDLLSHLRPRALGPLLRASETIEAKDLQPVLQEAVKGIAGANRQVLVELLQHEDPVVVAGAVRLVGRLHVEEASSALQALLKHPVPGVRLAAVEAALAVRASTIAGALQDSLLDSERDVRIAAARALGRLRYRPAAPRFRSVIGGKEVRGADITEKIAFFESYGEVADTQTVPHLDKLLNGKGLLGRREPVEVRACAALALGKVGTPEARAALERAVRDEEPVVRSAVGRALRAETGAEV